MLETFKNAWRIEDLRKKILYTLLMLLVYRIGTSFIPIAGMDVAAIKQTVEGSDILGFLNMITGGSLAGFTIFAVGISPYITASIVMQLLTFAIPALERLSKEGGEEGREKLKRITRYVGIGLALIMSIGMVMSLRSYMITTDLLSKITMVLTLTAGACIVMWMGEKITEKGIGNGVSLIIFVGIVARLPVTAWSFMQNIFAGEVNAWALLPIVVIYVAIVAGVVFIDCGERRIPVQYAKRVVGRKMYGGQSTNIPMKVHSAGVMPIIFAVTLLQFPGMIASFWPQSGFALWWGRWMNSATIPYNIIFAILIVALGYFYNMVTFNPVEVSKNIQQYGGFIPGIRPGKPTSDYLAKISSRLTLFGGLFLALLATLPGLIAGLVGTNIMALTATGVLISVSVALETSKQLESQMLMRHYKGFLK
ncbi:MAG: preprotein translocase subunit SecY [Clostridiales bacterium]|jgi:preprotein translocase, secY subunit|nr:preprotein translocase subunit SecY [Clostridiales bacterium]